MKMVHVTIQTSKFDEEVAFYEKYAGLSVVGDLRPHGKPIVFLAESEGDTQVEIINKPDAEKSGNPNISIGFKCADVEGLRQTFIDDGFRPTPLISPMPQVKFFFVEDPAGVNVQFI